MENKMVHFEEIQATLKEKFDYWYYNMDDCPNEAIDRIVEETFKEKIIQGKSIKRYTTNDFVGIIKEAMSIWVNDYYEKLME
ncbi:MAG: hypothetical protein FWC41_11400 [Firmicutes bacterium]|nr:hypothetical protein [Bacillota bacterium]